MTKVKNKPVNDVSPVQGEMTDEELRQRLERARQENLAACWSKISTALKEHSALIVGLPRYERTAGGEWVTVVDIGIEDRK